MKTVILTLGALLLLCGCAVHPVAISEQEHALRAVEDQRRLFDDQEAISAPVTLSDAMARALRHNTDYRVRLMEEAAAFGQARLANFDLLPRLTATAGYSTRDNDSFGFGYTPSGSISTTPSAASERNRNFGDLSFSWNVLDFGMSYMRAQQLANQALIAEERRRKAVQNLLQDVRTAWWRAEAAQRLLPEARLLLAEVDTAGQRARLIESRKMLPPLQIVAYKRSLLDLAQQVSVRVQDLAQAQVEFAQLLNLKPGQAYTLATPPVTDRVPADLTADIDTLEQIALQKRPELREEGYRAKNTDLENTRQFLSMMPALTLDTGRNYDANKYLVNNTWSGAGVNMSWNLLKLTSAGSIKRAGKAAIRIDETRRLAITAAVLGQTRIAAVRYRLLCEEFAMWDEAVNDDERIVGYLNSGKQAGLETEFELIRAKARVMVSKINRDLSYANVQSAVGRLGTSIGIDSLPLALETYAPEALSLVVAKTVGGWEGATFRVGGSAAAQPIAIAAPAGVDGADAELFATALRGILAGSKVEAVVAGASAPFTIESALELPLRGASGQPVIVHVRLVDAAGAVLYAADQNSMLMSPVDHDQWTALGESTGFRMVAPAHQFAVAKAADAARLRAAPTPAIDRVAVPSAAKLDGQADRVKVDTSNAVWNATQRDPN